MQIGKTEKNEQHSAKADVELDMYADDFGDKEKDKLEEAGPSQSAEENNGDKTEAKVLQWEFKWSQDNEEIQGPFSTEQMNKWSNEGYFKTGVWVRKYGESSNFYTSNRIDFDLYL